MATERYSDASLRGRIAPGRLAVGVRAAGDGLRRRYCERCHGELTLNPGTALGVVCRQCGRQASIFSRMTPMAAVDPQRVEYLPPPLRAAEPGALPPTGPWPPASSPSKPVEPLARVAIPIEPVTRRESLDASRVQRLPPVARPVRHQAEPARIALEAKQAVAHVRSGLRRHAPGRALVARPLTRLRQPTGAAVGSVHLAPAIAGFVADLRHRWPSVVPSIFVVAAAGLIGVVIANTPLR